MNVGHTGQTMRTLWGAGSLRGPWAYCCPPLHTNVDVAAMEGVKEALDQRGPLQGEGGHEEGKTHAAEAIALQEDHEKAEAYEDHGVHILEACRCVGGGRREGEAESRGLLQSHPPPTQTQPVSGASSQDCLEAAPHL